MSGGTSIFQMITGMGDSFSKSYEGAKKDALASDLGQKIKAGDYAGAADVALQGGDVSTGLALVKLGETRGANKQISDILGGLYGGGSAPDGGGTGTFGDLTQGRRQGGSSLPTFADTSGPSGDYVANLFKRESNNNTNARASTSSATGLGQFTTGTWQGLMRERPDLGLTVDGRTDPDQMLRATKAFTAQNEAILGKAGLPVTDATRYSLHFLGAGGGPKFVAGAINTPDAPAIGFVRPEQVRANRSIFFEKDGRPKTAGTVLSEFGASFGGRQAPAAPRVAFAANEAETQALERRMGMLPAAAPVQVANTEAETQALEQRMGMLPAGGGQPAMAAEADMPVRDAQQADFVIPPAQSGGGLTRIAPGGQGGTPTLGVPSQYSGTGPGSTGAGAGFAGAAGSQNGSVSASAPSAAPAIPTLPDFRGAVELRNAGVPNRVALAVGRMAPGSPERVQALIRASLIPGAPDTIKTLLSHELDRSKEGSRIGSEIRAREAEVVQRGLDPSEPGNRRYIFTGQMSDERSRSQIVKTEDGQQFVVDPDNATADPRRLNIPAAGVRIWGQPGPDGQIVQPPPGVQAGAAGYYDAKGVPQLVTGKGVNVTNNLGAGETEESKELGKLRGKRAEAIESAAMRAPDQIGKLNLLGSVLERATTGALGPAESTVVGFAQSLGIPNETLAGLGLNPQQAMTSQIATKLINESVVGMIGSGGFPSNNFSNTDREFLTDIFPKMSNRPEANRLAIEVMKRVQQRNLEFGDGWAEYQQERREAGKPASVAEYEFNFRKGLRDKPGLFDDLRQQFDTMPKAGGGGATGASPKAGERPQVVKGGKAPEGYTWDTYLARGRETLKSRPDLRPQIEDMLAKAGIPPERLGQ